MINSTSGTQSTRAAATFDFPSTTSTGSVDSFAQQLMTAIEGYLSNSSKGSQLEIDIQGPQGQNSGDNGQFVVTLTNTGGNSPAATAATTTPATVTPAVTTPTVSTPVTTTPGNTASTVADASATPKSALTATPLTAAELANMTPDEAYWAQQPPAVQALQYMPEDQRAAAGQALADQGYSIDVPIMVWGWDPMSTMIQRQIDGYAWVPAAQQSGVQNGPGLNVPGSPSYDPDNPPAGAIPVSTAFAIGTNGQDPWIHNINTTTGTVNS
ncbi:MAG: hypothetical protein ABSB35_33885 [Bryobacteraceae bacterium]